MWLGMWMTSCPEAMGWGFWVIFEKKKQLVEIRTWVKRVDFRASARPGQLGVRDVPRVVGSHRTVSIVTIMPLSHLVSKNLKVRKVIKVSYLNKESCQCFRIPMPMNVLRIRIFYVSVSWLYYSCIISRYGDLGNRHIMFITIEHIKNIGISEFENT